MTVSLKGVDSVEFAVKSLKDAEKTMPTWGFEKIGEGKTKQAYSSLWAQGDVKFLMSEGVDSKTPQAQFAKKHGDGIYNITFLVDDARKTYETVTKRGAKPLVDPKKESAGDGEVVTASVASFGDVVHSFVSREGTTAFSHWLPADMDTAPKGFGAFEIDHLTCNLQVGQLDQVCGFYEKVFGFKETRFFDIRTTKTGLISKVMQNPEGTVKVPINEPLGDKSQIQEFINQYNGPGVQHLALTTKDIVKSLDLYKKAGIPFLDVPDTYYEEVPKRVKNIRQDLAVLQKHRVLVDGDSSGYLLQIFSQNVMGPFFIELIQREGNKGFGEGNFRALFEAIERDQERRGVL